MEPLLLRLGEPRELLALVPHLLGFRPRDSAVAVSLRGPRSRVGLVARVDLGDLAEPVHGPQVARSLAAHLDRDGARRAVLVVYLDGDDLVHDPRVLAATAHTAEAFDVPFGGLEVLVVGTSRYRCLACDETCCPSDGHPLRDLDSTRAGAEMVLAGSVVAPGREQVGCVPAAPTDARRAVARVRRRRTEARLRAAAQGPAALAAWRVASLEAWRALAAAGPDTVTSRTALLGRVEAGLADRWVRDAVLVSALPGSGSLPERALSRSGPEQGAELRRALDVLVDPARGRAPGAEADAACAALEAVVAHGRRGDQAPATTLLATFAWWRGDGVRAAVLLDRALADDPDYRLAHLMRSAVDAGLPPGWARVPA